MNMLQGQLKYHSGQFTIDHPGIRIKLTEKNHENPDISCY